MTPEQLPSALDSFVKTNAVRNYLVVSRTEPSPPIENLFPEDSAVQWLCEVHTADDLVAVERADLGMVFNQLEYMEKNEGVYLLSRLRDQYCRRVVVYCSIETHSAQELLALGYIEQESPSGDGRLFLYDPELFFERRDWNSPEKWANPENFKKFRW